MLKVLCWTTVVKPWLKKGKQNSSVMLAVKYDQDPSWRACVNPLRKMSISDISYHTKLFEHFSSGQLILVLSLKWRYSFRTCLEPCLVTIQGQRLISETLHRFLSRKMAEKYLSGLNDSSYLDETVRVSMEFSVGDTGSEHIKKFRRELQHGIYSRKRWAYIWTHEIQKSNDFQRVSLSSVQPFFAYTARSEHSEILNEAVMCTSSSSKVCSLLCRGIFPSDVTVYSPAIYQFNYFQVYGNCSKQHMMLLIDRV